MTPEDELPLSQHDLLGEEDCADIAAQVMALSDRWTERTRGSFYTLGTASYLDAPGRHEAYLAATRSTNPVLQENFAGVLEIVRDFFDEFLGEPVFYDPRYALPGFHIFLLNGNRGDDENIAPRAHFDLQWMHAIPGAAPLGTLSFTLPIDQPTGGACLAVWPARYKDAVRLGFAARSYAAAHPWRRIAYETGRIVIHDGGILHAIGPAANSARGRRITLQGHGVRTPTGWMLYW